MLGLTEAMARWYNQLPSSSAPQRFESRLQAGKCVEGCEAWERPRLFSEKQLCSWQRCSFWLREGTGWPCTLLAC